MTTEAHFIYFICETLERPVAFFADPDAAIVAAIKLVNSDYAGLIPPMAVYKVPYGRILTYREFYRDCIWNALNQNEEIFGEARDLHVQSDSD